jgi:hypothetical protein
LIRANENARNALLGPEGLTEDDMRRIQAKFSALAKLGAIPEEIEEVQEHLEKAREDVQHAQDRVTRLVQQDSD